MSTIMVTSDCLEVMISYLTSKSMYVCVCIGVGHLNDGSYALQLTWFDEGTI